MGTMRFVVFGILVAFSSLTSGRDVCKMISNTHTLQCTNLTSQFLPTENFLNFNEDVPSFFADLKIFEIVHSNISTIERGIFSYMPKVSQIIMSNISLQVIELGAFEGLTKLKWLDLSFNKLKKIQSDSFKENTKLTNLKLEGNTELEIPTNGPIIENERLIWLSLKNCDIKHLTGSSFAPNTVLSHLDLSYNKLEMLPQEIFITLQHLVYLDLSYNNFQTIDPKVFSLMHLYPVFPKTAILAGNRWRCDCRLSQIVRWATESQNDSTWSGFPWNSRLRKAVFCQEPNHLKGFSWNDLRDIQLSC